MPSMLDLARNINRPFVLSIVIQFTSKLVKTTSLKNKNKMDQICCGEDKKKKREKKYVKTFCDTNLIFKQQFIFMKNLG